MKLYAILLLGLAVGVALMSCSLPRHSEHSIRARLLREMPPGSTYSTVLDYAKNKGWPVTEEPGGLETMRIAVFPARVVGKRVIKADLGEYQGFPWRKAVCCYWAFNERDKLIDVFIEKQADAL